VRNLIDRIGYVPKTCVWEITRACNLNCQHCGTGAGTRRQDELSTEQAVDLMGQLAALGNRLTTLSGGEPTVREDWPEIARAGIEAGVIVNMVSNGQTPNPKKLAKQVIDVGLANVAISIDGLEDTHDRIRKIGAFARATETVRTLARAGIWVDLMLTANRLNLSEIEQVYILGEKLGARGFRVQIGKPMGNQTSRDDLTLVPSQMLELMAVLGRLAHSPGPVVAIGDSVGYFSPWDKTLRSSRSAQGHWTGCYAGVRAIGIQSDGTIKGCLSLQPREGEEDHFIEGSVRDASLADIWNRPGGFAYNRSSTDDDLSGFCAECSYGKVCRGGAKCAAHAFTGELGCDPMCFHAAAMAQKGERQRIWASTAAAAAASMVLTLSPACGSGSEPDYGIEVPDSGHDAGADGDADGDIDGAPEASVDYGVADAAPEASVDYGVADAAPEASMDYGVEDAAPEASMDYGVEDAAPEASMDYGVEDAAASCSDVNCADGVETIGLEIFRDCCCEDVCCMCDYGDPPPDGCCD